MRVDLFVVNYHADAHVLRFLESVAVARAEVPTATVDVHVLDNSSRTEDALVDWRRRLQNGPVPATVHTTGVNVGYFGHLSLAQRLARGASTVVYCNPDILLDRSFFAELAKVEERGVLAPAIVSIEDGFDQNPKYESRLPASKLKRLETIYGRRFLFWALITAGKLKERVASRRTERARSAGVPREIYAPHGAIFVFTDPAFFRALPRYPCFLFGEELFVAEEARRMGVPVLYRPRLRVDDVRHASVSALPPGYMRSLLKDSVVYIQREYYGDGRSARG